MQLAKAAFWQLLFVARGASAEIVRSAAEEGLMILRGFTPARMAELVEGALEPVLKPLVYPEAVALAREHQERGEPVYIVSAMLQEIADAIAADLGFDGALGTVCEVVDGKYTGRWLRSCHGAGKAAAVRELADTEGFDLRVSTAYSDSHSDIPFLEIVGRPVAVNPDRELRRSARERGWPVVEFGVPRRRFGRRAA